MQLLINQLQDVSTRGSLSTAYKCCKQLTKTLMSKRPAVDWLIVAYCSSVNFANVNYVVHLCMIVFHWSVHGSWTIPVALALWFNCIHVSISWVLLKVSNSATFCSESVAYPWDFLVMLNIPMVVESPHCTYVCYSCMQDCFHYEVCNSITPVTYVRT